jgi:hypothetical protein
MTTIATFLDRALLAKDNPAELSKIKSEVAALCQKFPMPH